MNLPVGVIHQEPGPVGAISSSDVEIDRPTVCIPTGPVTHFRVRP